MTRLTRARRLGVGACLAGLLLVAGCGGAADDGDGKAGKRAAEFASRLREAQKAAGSFRFRLQSSGALAFEGEGETTTRGARESRTVVRAGTRAIETRVVDGRYYVKGLPSVKPWFEVDAGSTSAIATQLQGNSDPTRALDAFGSASRLAEGGTEKVGGVTTTTYTVSLSGEALGKALKYPTSVINQLPRQIEYAVYVDRKDLVRRLTTTFAVSGKQIRSDVTFTAYGARVAVAAPPATQTTTKVPDLGG